MKNRPVCIDNWNDPSKYDLTNETDHFVLMMKKNSIAPFVIIQVSNFEGYAYPDHLDANMDWDDRVNFDDCIAWSEININHNMDYNFYCFDCKSVLVEIGMGLMSCKNCEVGYLPTQDDKGNQTLTQFRGKYVE